MMARAKILIVEDESIVALDIKTMLTSLGYDISALVDTGEKAIRKVAAIRPNLVLMDIKLKGEMDGVTAAEKIRVQFNVPVIYLTAYADETTLERAKITEPYGYLLKPFEERELHTTIEMTLYRHKMERKLIESERWLVATLESIGEAVITVDAQGRIKSMNPVAEELTGWRQAEAVSLDSAEVFHFINEGVSISGESLIARAFQKGVVVALTSFSLVAREGGEIPIDGNITPIRDAGGNIIGTAFAFRDISEQVRLGKERQRLEEQYRQAQKMEAVGLLAGGIAHDFNNLLTSINGYAILVKMRLSSDDPLQDWMGTVIRSGNRAADLVRQLLTFSRKQVIEPKVLDLNASVEEMDKMLQRLIGEDIQVETIFAPNLWLLKADPTQIEQIIVNLVVNARDAMPTGGRLTIETANVVLDEDYAASHLEVQPGKYVLLTVSDTGQGMSEEVIARIFEPFYTTKKVGQGTGLGLATIHGIIKQHLGHIKVDSKEGHGTAFKVYLPRAAEESISHPEDERTGDLPSGIEVILLVEDDQMVREMAAHTLLGQGYTVLEAANGQEALRFSQEHNGKIQLLLTDLIMPEINGKDLAEQMLRSHPKLRVLLMSGYAGSKIAQYGVSNSGIPFLQKPFSPQDLAHKVRQVLDSGE